MVSTFARRGLGGRGWNTIEGWGCGGNSERVVENCVFGSIGGCTRSIMHENMMG